MATRHQPRRRRAAGRSRDDVRLSRRSVSRADRCSSRSISSRCSGRFGMYDVGATTDGQPLELPPFYAEAEREPSGRADPQSAKPESRPADADERQRSADSDALDVRQLSRSVRIRQCKLTMRRRVVVTGMGCVTPLGNDVETLWAGLKEGKSGVGYTTLFDASNFPTQDLGRGQELGHRRRRRRRRASGSSAAGTRSSPSAPPSRPMHDSGVLGRQLDPDALRRLSGQRRRPAGLLSPSRR